MSKGKGLTPGEPRKPVIERAFELARTGQFGKVEEIDIALWREGYSKADMMMSSPSLRKQLRAICLDRAKNV